MRWYSVLVRILFAFFCYHAICSGENGSYASASRCTKASKYYERAVISDPSPPRTYLSKTTIRLVFNFADLLDIEFHTSRPMNADEIDVVGRVLKREIFTLSTRHHFVLPSNARQHLFLFDRIRRFAAKWFDPATAECTERKLSDAIDKVTTDLRTMLTMDDFNALVHKTMGLDSNQPYHIMPPTVRRWSHTWKPDVYFSYKDLLKRNLDEVSNATAVSRWLENFVVRKFIIHNHILSLANVNGKPILVKESLDEGLLDVLKDHFRARAIFNLTKSEAKFRCIYMNVLNEYAVNFQAQSWTYANMDEFRRRILEALDGENALLEKLGTVFDQIVQKDLAYMMLEADINSPNRHLYPKILEMTKNYNF